MNEKKKRENKKKSIINQGKKNKVYSNESNARDQVLNAINKKQLFITQKMRNLNEMKNYSSALTSATVRTSFGRVDPSITTKRRP